MFSLLGVNYYCAKYETYKDLFNVSFYAETYHLLPDSLFGGRPGHDTEQALLV